MNIKELESIIKVLRDLGHDSIPLVIDEPKDQYPEAEAYIVTVEGTSYPMLAVGRK